MSYYCVGCDGCSASYKPGNAPVLEYIPGKADVSYSVASAALPASYSFSGDAGSSYAASLMAAPSVQNRSSDDTVKIISPSDVQVLPPSQRRDGPDLETIQSEEFRNNPGLRQHLPKDEIDRAISRIKGTISVEESIEIRMKRSITIHFSS